MADCEITIPADRRHEDLASTLTVDANTLLSGERGLGGFTHVWR
jgi:hypothetical protein